MQTIKSKLKSVFAPKPPKYKAYTPQQLKTIALKSRIVLQQMKKKMKLALNHNHRKFLTISTKYLTQKQILDQYKKNNQIIQMYTILQNMSQQTIEIQSITILVQLIKKIENNCTNIIRLDGDLAQLRHQSNWFRAILWFRQCKNVPFLEILPQFCFNFFKGVDITSQISIKCQLFQKYPILGYLQKDKKALNVQEFYNHIIAQLDQPTIDPNIFYQICKKGKKTNNKPNPYGQNPKPQLIHENPHAKSSIVLTKKQLVIDQKYNQQQKLQMKKKSSQVDQIPIYPINNHNNNFNTNNNNNNNNNNNSNNNNFFDDQRFDDSSYKININEISNISKLQEQNNNSKIVSQSKIGQQKPFSMNSLFRSKSAQPQSNPVQQKNQQNKPNNIQQKQQIKQLQSLPKQSKDIIPNPINKFNPIQLNDNRQYDRDSWVGFKQSVIQKKSDNLQLQHLKQKQSFKYQQQTKPKYVPIYNIDNERLLRSQFSSQSFQEFGNHNQIDRQQFTNELKKQSQEIILNEQQNDQLTSIQIMKKYLRKDQNNFIKKPYMVSIYARKQYTDNKK